VRQARGGHPQQLFPRPAGPILDRPWSFLSELNRAATAWLFERFDVSTECVLGSELGVTGRRDDLIIDLCLQVGGTTYLSGQGAPAY
jgi:hypothetical protein